MERNIIRKGLVFGLILLLIVTGYFPSITGDMDGNLANIETGKNMRLVSVSKGSLRGDSPEIEWLRIYGERHSNDWIESVDQTTDGGYILAGMYGYDDGWLLKTDKYGFEEWNKTFGEPGYLKIDKFHSVQQTTDYGYIICGDTRSYNESDEMRIWLVKTDCNGDEQWNKTYGPGRGYSVQQTTDGRYIIGGDDYPYSLMIKTDCKGTEQWKTRFWREPDWSVGESVAQALDDGYVLTGEVSDEVFLVKADGDGNELWNKTYGWGRGMSVRSTTYGGYIVTGSGGLLFKTDENGILEWDVLLGKSRWWGYCGEDVQQTMDEGYVIAGERGRESGNHDAWLVKSDSSGNKEWELPLACGWFFDSLYYSVQQTSDKGFIAAGYVSRTMIPPDYLLDAILIKLAPEIKVEITKPEGALYVFNRKVMSLPIPLIIGTIDVEVDTSDVEFYVEGVKFYVDGDLKHTDTGEPYSWKWDTKAFFTHSIEVVAYDNDGNRSSKAIMVRKFF